MKIRHYSMPEAFIQDPNVALKWKLYAHLNGFWIGGKTFYARNDTLAKIFKKSERAIQSALSELEQMGLITRDIKGLSRYILPGGIREARSPASPPHEAQLHQGHEAQLHHSSDSSSDNLLSAGAEEKESSIEATDGEGNPLPQKRAKGVKAPNQVLEFFKLFDNPAREAWGLIPAQRNAAKMLLEKYGFDKAKKFYEASQKVKGELHAPQVNSPYDLLTKLANLKDHEERRN